jgi:hypothetical protein
MILDRISSVWFYPTVNFSRWLFRIAGIYGLIVLVPQYFMEDQLGRTYPPLITHPEYFYGFLGVAVAWQVAFLLIAQDPVRYRLLIIPAILEKFSFAVAAVVLYTQHRVPVGPLAGGLVDSVLGSLFVIAFCKSAPRTDVRT